MSDDSTPDVGLLRAHAAVARACLLTSHAAALCDRLGARIVLLA
jgi:hypothetical protein